MGTAENITVRFFEGKDCSVCHAVKPKLKTMINARFPDIPMEIIATDEHPEIAAQAMVFTVPVVQILLDDRELHRFARGFSVHQVETALGRLVALTR